MARFMLIGLDGLEPSLAEGWMAAGRLPNLARLRQQGSYLRCASTRPPVTFPAWTTCVTGVNPGRHGIFDFTEVVPGRYGLRFVNRTFRKVPALWNSLSEAGKRCCVLGVPGTYPPEPINGVMVSGFDSPVAAAVGRGSVYPPARYPQVRQWRFADFQESHIGPGWHAQALDKLLAKVADKEAIALDLWREEPWDFFMAVFGESDAVAHHFWMFHDTASPRHQPGHETAIRQVYERLDTAVGRLAAEAGEDVVVGVVSDHGFGGAGTGVVHFNNWLAEHGYLAFNGGGGTSALKSLALKTAPARLRGTLFRKLEGLAARAESASRFGGIDWPRTRAWSEELNYFPSIRLNLQGREPEGQVPPEKYDEVVEALCAELEAWSPVARAWPRPALFDGPEVHRAPDIIVELGLEDGYAYSCLRSRGGPPFRRLRPEEYLGGKEQAMSGNHRDPGVLFLSERTDAGAASLADVAPTVFAALGVAGPPMEGRDLMARGDARPPEGNGDWARGDARPSREAEAPYTAEEEKLIEARLRALGYYE